MIGDFHCDIHSSSIRAYLALDLLPIAYRIAPKALDNNYIFNSGDATDTDHFICSTDVPCSVVHSDEDEHDFGPLPISLSVILTADPSNNLCVATNKKWCET